MTSLYLVVEGRTEQTFVHDVLAPHLAERGVYAHARLLGRPGHKGGNVDYPRVRGDLLLLLRQFKSPAVRFSTMLDLYALGRDFPGMASLDALADGARKVTMLEEALTSDIADRRFFAHLQLHEFEALLFADVTALGRVYDDPAAAAALAAEVGGLAPEAIDEGPATSPSKRIIRHFGRYARDKVTAGPLCAHDIGLEVMRSACPHFAAWLSRLESLGR